MDLEFALLGSLAGAYFASRFAVSMCGNEGLLVALNATIDPPFTSPARAFWMSILLSMVHATIDPPFPSPTPAFRMSGLLVELNATIDPPFTSPTTFPSPSPAFRMSVLLVELNATIDPPFPSPTRVFLDECLAVAGLVQLLSIARVQVNLERPLERWIFTPVNNTGDRYEVNRSFQRGSESRAVEYQPTLPFNKHYTDISLCLDSFLRCTPAM